VASHVACIRTPVTGKPVADTTVYDYDATAHGGGHYRVTFRRENAIVQGSARWRSSSGIVVVTEGDRPPGLANLRS